LQGFRIVSNPTDDDIARNKLPVEIFVQFTATAEFIPITFIVTATGV
jgi:hypothetical protein